MSKASSTKDPAEVRAELQGALDQAEWAWLAPFAKRDAVILVDATLDLVETGLKIVLDDKALIGTWVNQGLLQKPTSDQLRSWEQDSKRRFMILVVQPYVLAQERVVH